MTQAKVFAVTQQEADTAHDVVTGMILVFERDAHILIDPRVHILLFLWGLSQMLMWSPNL